MAATFVIPFLASLAVATLRRIVSGRLWPRVAVPAIAAATAALAATTVGALVLIACPLPAQVPLVAAAGR